MRKTRIIWLSIGIVIVILFFATKSGYNNMIKQREMVKSQWSNVENQYQRRADLIPNLVNTVKGYATHEATTLQSIVDARSRATQMQVNFDQLDQQTISKYNETQGEVSSALGKLLAISENYPNLKANENFKELNRQLEGTENRIAVERRKFNESAQHYNSYIMQFPRNLFVSMFDFEKIVYFTAETGSEKAPEVTF